ncbi:hypothetical protein [Streptomyces sp. NPDC047141]|uniref:hypothetical protein n=1 Tax=Streptomyces sp. NPDC047141 TaxID=3155738 RepID=UPI003402470C
MTEPVTDTVTEAVDGPPTGPAPETVTVPAPEPAPEAAPRKAKGRARRVLGVVLPAVLALGLVGGGVTYTAVTVSSADRSAPTRLWGEREDDATAKESEDPAAALARGRTGTPLSRLLLPLPEGWEFGPDEELYGNDGELGAAEATALMKQAGKGLSGKKRRAFEKEVDKLGIQGVGVRSFADPDHDVTVTFELASMKDKKKIRNSFRIRTGVLDALEAPKGPKVKDHKNAVCYRSSEDEELSEKERAAALEGMVCLAYESEVLVTMTAVGAKPFDGAAAADLLKKQLDHIASPGEYV